MGEARTMGQYFTLVNADKEQFVNLPGPMKATERLSNPVAMATVGFLLLDGPNDASGVGVSAIDNEALADEIEAKLNREEQSEKETFERYLDERPDYIVSQFQREAGESPEESPRVFEGFCWEKSRSTYRNDDGTWDDEKVRKIAISSLDIEESHNFAGSWAGDRVFLTGDYSDSGYHKKTKKHTIARSFDGEMLRLTGVREEVTRQGEYKHQGSISNTDNIWADVGDFVKSHEDGEEVVAQVVEIESTEYQDITDGVLEELEKTMGESFMENDNSLLLQPDMVINGR